MIEKSACSAVAIQSMTGLLPASGNFWGYRTCGLPRCYGVQYQCRGDKDLRHGSLGKTGSTSFCTCYYALGKGDSQDKLLDPRALSVVSSASAVVVSVSAILLVHLLFIFLCPFVLRHWVSAYLVAIRRDALEQKRDEERQGMGNHYGRVRQSGLNRPVPRRCLGSSPSDIRHIL